MKAIVVQEFGGAERLGLADRPDPRPGPGEITVAVAFAGVGLVDAMVRAGRFEFAQPPLIPGIEVSGTVHEVGPGVTGLRPGQRVAALLTDFTDGGMGGYAELARAKAALTVALEDADDLATAAAVLVNGATAVLATEGLPPAARVAISGASGGLGQALIGAVAAAGAAEIVAISGSPARHSVLARAGATAILTPERFEESGPAVDVAFDTVGGPLRLALLRRLVPGGHLHLLGNASGIPTALDGDEVWLRSVTVSGLATGGISHLLPDRVRAAARTALTAAARRPPDFEILDLVAAPAAHRRLEERAGPGKIVLRVR